MQRKWGRITCLLKSIFNYNSSWELMNPFNLKIQVFLQLRDLFFAHTHKFIHTCMVLHMYTLFISISPLFSFSNDYCLLTRSPRFVLFIIPSFQSWFSFLSLYFFAMCLKLLPYLILQIAWWHRFFFPFHLWIVLIWKLWFDCSHHFLKYC